MDNNKITHKTPPIFTRFPAGLTQQTIRHRFWNPLKRKAGDAPAFREDSRQRPTFPRGCPRSIISTEGKPNDRVRDGYGWVPFAIATGNTNHTSILLWLSLLIYLLQARKLRPHRLDHEEP